MGRGSSTKLWMVVHARSLPSALLVAASFVTAAACADGLPGTSAPDASPQESDAASEASPDATSDAPATNMDAASPVDASLEAMGTGGDGAGADAPDAFDVPDAPDAGAVPDTQMKGKLLFGYQGWFACPGDGSRVNRWQHWSSAPPGKFEVDFWPDVSELGAPELFPIPGVTMPDGGSAYVFSAFPAATVMRHFQWMRQYGLDGALPAPRRPVGRETVGPAPQPPADPGADSGSGSRPPLPRRRPQEHLATSLLDVASEPASRVGDEPSPTLMADFRGGLARGAAAADRAAESTDHLFNQEGAR